MGKSGKGVSLITSEKAKEQMGAAWAAGGFTRSSIKVMVGLFVLN